MVTGTVTTKDHMQDMEDALELIKKTRIYVGIPEEKASREDGNDMINNAELLYIHSNGIRRKEMRDAMQGNLDAGMAYGKAYDLYVQEQGSPLWHAPPRPVLEPAIEANIDDIVDELGTAYKEALNGRAAAEKGLRRVGLHLQNIARNWFEDSRNGWAPNSPLTIARKGSELPLVDTGDLRSSIVYVLRKEGER